MQFIVSAIEFDYDEGDDFPEHGFDNVLYQTAGMIWEAEDDDDLVDQITDATGWCLKSIEFTNLTTERERSDYQHQLSVMIAEALEKLQPLDPILYGEWYSRLYPPHGNINRWTISTLHTLEQHFIDLQ